MSSHIRYDSDDIESLLCNAMIGLKALLLKILGTFIELSEK